MKRFLFLFLIIGSFIIVTSVISTVAHEEGHAKGMHRHTKYSKIKNPVKADKKSIAKGKEIYESRCSICHGIEGKGNGPLSKSLTPHPADFTDSVWKHGESDGEIFMVITNGVENTAMPSFKDLKEEDRWNLVNYIKTFKSNVLLEHKTD